MTVVNGKALLEAAPIANMLDRKVRLHGVSHGLAEAGYDLRIAQAVTFVPPNPIVFWQLMDGGHLDTTMIEAAFHGYTEVDGVRTAGRCALASSIERFQMPNDLVAVMGHKSTRARGFTCCWAGTTAEPGWSGFLTIELTFHGNEPVTIPAGSGIVQVLFHQLAEPGDYGSGKYQNQASRPVAAILEKG